MAYFENFNIENDQYGFHITSDPQGKLCVEMPIRLVGTSFGSVTDPNFWTVAKSGTGAVADGGVTTANWATLTSGTSNNGYGSITTVRKSWFIPANPIKLHAYARLTTLAVTGTTRAWGAMSISGNPPVPQDGFYFSVNASGTLSVNSANSGVVTSVASGSFNGQVSSVTLDTNQHHYDIMFGAFGAYFFVDGVMIHNMAQTTSPLTSTFILPASAYAENSASGTTSATLQLAMLGTERLGRHETMPTSAYFAATTTGTVLKYGAGQVHRLLVGAPGSSTTITIYDNTSASGTVLWSGTFPSGGSPIPLFLEMEFPFYTGLTIVITTNVAVTIVYE
jgi:hypothetical protein